MQTRTMVAIATLSVLALAGAGCARKSSTAPGSALTPGVSVDIGVKAQTDAGTGVSVKVEDVTGGTVTIKDEGTAPKDEGATVPEGDNYSNSLYGFSFEFPKGWSIRDQKIDGGIQVDIHPTPLPVLEDGTDATAAITLRVDGRMLDQAIADLAPYESVGTETVALSTVKKILYNADLPDEHLAVAYVFSKGNLVYEVVGRPDDDALKGVLTSLIQHQNGGE